jgi:hypothetical protein
MVSHVTSGSLNISTFMAVDWHWRRLAYMDQMERNAGERLSADTFADTYCNTSYSRQKSTVLPTYLCKRAQRSCQITARSATMSQQWHVSKSQACKDAQGEQYLLFPMLPVECIANLPSRCQHIGAFPSHQSNSRKSHLSCKGRCHTLRVRCVVVVCNHSTDGTQAMQRTVTSARNSRIPPLPSRVSQGNTKTKDP